MGTVRCHGTLQGERVVSSRAKSRTLIEISNKSKQMGKGKVGGGRWWLNG